MGIVGDPINSISVSLIIMKTTRITLLLFSLLLLGGCASNSGRVDVGRERGSVRVGGIEYEHSSYANSATIGKRSGVLGRVSVEVSEDGNDLRWDNDSYSLKF